MRKKNAKGASLRPLAYNGNRMLVKPIFLSFISPFCRYLFIRNKLIKCVQPINLWHKIGDFLSVRVMLKCVEKSKKAHYIVVNVIFYAIYSDLRSQLIHVRETHGKSNRHLFLIFHDGVDLVPDITGRFLDF